MPTHLLAAINQAFPATVDPPQTSLKQANEIDSTYGIQSINDPLPADWRHVLDIKLESDHWGLPHLDPSSWLFYLPAF